MMDRRLLEHQIRMLRDARPGSTAAKLRAMLEAALRALLRRVGA